MSIDAQNDLDLDLETVRTPRGPDMVTHSPCGEFYLSRFDRIVPIDVGAGLDSSTRYDDVIDKMDPGAVFDGKKLCSLVAPGGDVIVLAGRWKVHADPWSLEVGTRHGNVEPQLV